MQITECGLYTRAASVMSPRPIAKAYWPMRYIIFGDFSFRDGAFHVFTSAQHCKLVLLQPEWPFCQSLTVCHVHRRRLLEVTVWGEISRLPFLSPFPSPFLPSLNSLSSPVLPVLPLSPHLPLLSPVMSLYLPFPCPCPYPLNPATEPGERCKLLQRVGTELLVHFQSEINAPFSVS